MIYWLSYGGGVNSTALAVLILSGQLPEYQDCRFLFSDTGDERPETYNYIDHVFVPYLKRHGHKLEVCKPKESVMERWERLKVTGSRILRSCTVEAKIRPMDIYRKKHGSPEDVILIGIDADEPHRAKNDPSKRFPLIDLDIGRDECLEIIQWAGLCLPYKSGCWCCPFSRAGDIIKLAREYPDQMARIAALEKATLETHGRDFHQFRDKPVEYWIARASQGEMFETERIYEEVPCGCYDG